MGVHGETWRLEFSAGPARNHGDETVTTQPPPTNVTISNRSPACTSTTP